MIIGKKSRSVPGSNRGQWKIESSKSTILTTIRTDQLLGKRLPLDFIYESPLDARAQITTSYYLHVAQGYLQRYGYKSRKHDTQ